MVPWKAVSLVDAKVYEKVDLRVDVRAISMVVEKEFYSVVSKVVELVGLWDHMRVEHLVE